MKTTLELLNKVVAMGFDRQKALEEIDMALDDELGFENRKPIEDEVLSDELFDTIVLGFVCEKDYWDTEFQTKF